MKKFLLLYFAAAMSLVSVPAFSQKKGDSKVDTTNKLGLAGDGLDLYAVLDLFQNSKTIESFEKSLNDSKKGINNLDLDLDKKVDFIKVVTEKKDKKDESYMFVLRVDVSKKESQDVAVILLDRDKDKKVSLQIVGDEELYGKDYVIEPKGNSPITPNPAYKGDDPVTVTVEAQPTTVVVQQAPIVQYVYSPAYAPYYPPYYYGYYPGWFAFTAVVSFGFYCGAWGGYHGGYYGGHYHNTNVIINNNNNFNNYNNNKMRSDQVRNNQDRGNYGNGSTKDRAGDRQGNRQGNRPSAGTQPAGGNRGGNNASSRPSAGTSDRSASNRQSPSASNRQSPSTSNRQYNSPSTRQSSSYNGGRSTGGSYGGGGFSGGSRGGGGFGGGGGGRRR